MLRHWSPASLRSSSIVRAGRTQFDPNLMGKQEERRKSRSKRMASRARTLDSTNVTMRTLNKPKQHNKDAILLRAKLNPLFFQSFTCPICPTSGVTGCQIDSKSEGCPNETTRCFEIGRLFSNVACVGEFCTRDNGR